MKKKLTLVFIAFISTIMSIYSQKSAYEPSQQDNAKEIGYLKRDILGLESNLKETTEKLNSANEIIQKHQELYENVNKYVVIGISLILLLGGGVVWFFNQIKKKAQDEIEAILKNESDTLMKEFRENNIEKKIQENTKVLVLVDDSSKKEIINHLLKRKNNFKNIDFQPFQTKTDISSFDVILFIGKNDSSEDINEINNFIMNSSIEKKYFYFGNGFLSTPVLEKYVISSSRFQSQIVGNLMNILKYN